MNYDIRWKRESIMGKKDLTIKFFNGVPKIVKSTSKNYNAQILQSTSVLPECQRAPHKVKRTPKSCFVMCIQRSIS